MANMNDDELLDALGVEVTPLKAASRTPREERIITGFEDILRFHQIHGRAPLHGEDCDIFERLYAVRLDQLRKLPEAQTLLAGLDGPGLLSGAAAASTDIDDMDEDALLAELGVGYEPVDQNDITVLRHVRSSTEKRAAEDIADRTPCADFNKFQPLFEQVERDLTSSARKTLRFGRDTSIETGNYFIVGWAVSLCGRNRRNHQGSKWRKRCTPARHLRQRHGKQLAAPLATTSALQGRHRPSPDRPRHGAAFWRCAGA